MKSQVVVRPERKLYFAYGSNLWIEGMWSRCPAAKPVRSYYATNGLLVFRGVADVVGTGVRGDEIAGGLWRITAACEEALDRYEGVASGLYVKKYFKVDGERCLYYQMTSRGVHPPYEGYLDTIVRGYFDFSLELDTLADAVSRSHRDKVKTPDLMRRWVARGKPRLANEFFFAERDDEMEEAS